ncbi:phosphoribosyltransferase [Thermanaerovibrio acidaminovorans DSM 6589]|jgi:predicted amidophosphoribosyltransferase|uniref:Phosphoribosyltransferase n=1 Tax=Thermanaerovibrio acidaminovorans (strain ATCC 49978 / DSM 6589 / Su883) TaxID=525903 RepID=D1B9E4_THEAS|nr:ComF family protein [Thermanaerovibrio acidaminovorans]ACZ18897.1 phosphoribosyltransferase [Thermanaerovibrio acidaminovorans DSM 6589]
MTRDGGAFGPLFALLEGMGRGVFHVFLPVSCPVCGALGYELCPGCAVGLLANGGSVLLDLGGSWLPVHHGGLHRGTLRDVIHRLKYKGLSSLGVPLGEALGEVFGPMGRGLVPVPLHVGSRRGYNQSELIARGISSVWGVPVADYLRWRVRVGNQVSSGDRVLPRGAMEWTGPPMDGLVLVDDVLTSGATLRAAVEALKAGSCGTEGALVLSLAKSFGGSGV